MDNPPPEPSQSPLNTDQAAALFADMLDPEREQAEKEATPEASTEPVEAQPETAEAETEDDPTVTVIIDGKPVDVPLSELKNGYQRQSDYTRKTMEAAELRKQAEAETAKAHQERQAYAVNLQRMQAQIEGALQEQQQIDWNRLLETDPVEYLKQQHLFQQRQAAHQANLAQQQQLAAMSKAEAEQAHQRHLANQYEALLNKLPDWKDEKKLTAEKTALREYLVQEGFDTNEVSSISDARAVVLARKAMLYDQMISKASAAAKKVQNLPTKMERSGTGQSQSLDKRGAAFQRLSKSGKVEDAAAVFASLI